MLTPVGKRYNIYFRTVAPFGGKNDIQKLQNGLSSKAIWSPKTTFDGEMPEAKSVALIPTSSKLPLNPL